jgi:MSHA pilin protein MshC
MTRNRHTPIRARLQRGFTVIELVTVVVILGIVAVVAAPRMFNNAIFNQRGYADEIAGALRYSQRIALASGCNVRVIVNAAGYSAVQPNVRCVTGGAWNTAVLSPDRRPLANVAPAGIVVNAAVIEFNGAPPPAARLIAPVAPLNVGTFAVTIDAAGGSVTVQ